MKEFARGNYKVIIGVVLMSLFLLFTVGISAGAIQVLELENKNETYVIIPDDGINGTVEYEDTGDLFVYDLKAYGLSESTNYSLIYYADKPDRFNNWGGNNPGALVVQVESDTNGNISINGEVELDMNLPEPQDYNINPGDTYCTPPDGYGSCCGAKIWLVPFEALPDPYPGDGNWNTPWSVVRYEMLFETNLIQYNDTNHICTPSIHSVSVNNGEEITAGDEFYINATVCYYDNMKSVIVDMSEFGGGENLELSLIDSECGCACSNFSGIFNLTEAKSDNITITAINEEGLFDMIDMQIVVNYSEPHHLILSGDTLRLAYTGFYPYVPDEFQLQYWAEIEAVYGDEYGNIIPNDSCEYVFDATGDSHITADCDHASVCSKIAEDVLVTAYSNGLEGTHVVEFVALSTFDMLVEPEYLYGDCEDSATVSVQMVDIEGNPILLDNVSVDLYIVNGGLSEQLDPVLTDEDGIAFFDIGPYCEPMTVTLHAVAEDKECEVIFEIKENKSSEIILPEYEYIWLRDTVEIEATCINSHGGSACCPDLEWSSLIESVATIDAAGNLTAEGPGITYITASNGSMTSNIMVVSVQNGPVETEINASEEFVADVNCTIISGNLSNDGLVNMMVAGDLVHCDGFIFDSDQVPIKGVIIGLNESVTGEVSDGSTLQFSMCYNDTVIELLGIDESTITLLVLNETTWEEMDNVSVLSDNVIGTSIDNETPLCDTSSNGMISVSTNEVASTYLIQMVGSLLQEPEPEPTSQPTSSRRSGRSSSGSSGFIISTATATPTAEPTEDIGDGEKDTGTIVLIEETPTIHEEEPDGPSEAKDNRLLYSALLILAVLCIAGYLVFRKKED